VRFAGEMALSMAFLSSCGAFGLVAVLLFHAATSAALTLVLFATLGETNPRHAAAAIPRERAYMRL
jgi:hypothetical protein